MNFCKYLLCTFFLFPWISFSQNEMDTSMEDKETTSWEFVLTTNYAYAFSEQNGSFVLEGNITYWLTEHFGLGASYAAKFEEDELFSDIPVLMSIKATEKVTVNLGPNFGLPNDERDFELGAYVEAEFNFELKESIHFGPVVGAVIAESTDMNFGIHFGFEF